MTLDETVARDDIRQLLFRYAWALDSRDVGTLVSLFVAGTVTHEFWDGVLRDIGVTVLHVGNHLIDFEAPGQARGVVYCLGRVEDPPGSGRIVEQAIVYFDDYRRGDDGGWRFARRRHELFWGVELPHRPLDQPDANWPASPTGRGTLPHRLDTWRSFWSPGT
jgi:hypothetical protein